jgi:hypothetical protein
LKIHLGRCRHLHRAGPCSLCPLSHGRRWALPAIRRPWMSAGLPGAAMDRRHDRPGRPRKGRPWGGVRTGAAAGGSPSASFAGSRVCGARPVTGTSAGLEARTPDRQQRAAALAGVHRVGLPPLRGGPGQRAGHTGRPTGSHARVRGSSGPGRLCHCNGPRIAGSRRPGSRRWSRGRCLPDSGARLGPGRGPLPGGRMRASRWLAGPGFKTGPGPRPLGLDDHVPGPTGTHALLANV